MRGPLAPQEFGGPGAQRDKNTEVEHYILHITDWGFICGITYGSPSLQE